jgi:hypothetical protein
LRKWTSQADQKGQHIAYDALALNPYFHYFYGSIPPISEALLDIYFDVYLPMVNTAENTHSDNESVIAEDDA